LAAGWFIIIALLIFLVGYSIGRRTGIKEGYNEGMAYAPIEIKREYFEHGRCPICGFRDEAV
jgi:hypothetical protein